MSCSWAEVPTHRVPLTGRETGIDVGVQVFLLTAEGERVATPRHYRTAERELKKAHKRVSRRTKGSHRRKKAVKLLARKHQPVRRQRTDFHPQTASALLSTSDTITISLDDVPVRNLVRNPPRAKSLSAAGWAAFRPVREAKAAWAGRRVLAVPPAFTAQDCRGCGERKNKSLSVRPPVGHSCGLVLDRDENAARTIQWAGQALRGVGAVVPAMNREAPSLSGWGACHLLDDPRDTPAKDAFDH